ncbi:MAG: hypothetical protein F9K46_18440 [Anaerolineae bacterium]|nr:MAG: hypothetical protein F9K46_18440 [Anaerolineae bacterium]
MDDDATDALYPPYHKLDPYPKYLVINIYGGYTLVSDRVICITNQNQYAEAQKLQTKLNELGFRWDIHLATADAPCKRIGVKFEIQPLEKGKGSYQIDIGVFSPMSPEAPDSVIALEANDDDALANGVTMLLKVIEVGLELDGEAIASMWIRDWE